MVITALLLILGMTTAVGLLRTADHKSDVEMLQSASMASASLEHARGEFLNATNSLAALAITKEPLYFLKYQQSRQVTLDDLTMARTLAQSRDEAEQIMRLDELIGRVNGFDQSVSGAAQAFLAGDEQAATNNISTLGDAAIGIVADLATAAGWERQVVADQTVGMNDALNVTLALQLALGALAIAIGVTAAGTLVISVLRPLASLRASARAIAGGDLSARAVVSGPEEVRSLARAFNQMTDSVISRTRELEESARERLKAEESLRVANELLEQRVRERTERLTRLNAKLEEEIAERKKAEQALLRSEEYFRSLIEKSSDIIVIVDADGVIRYASPSLKRTLGYDPSELQNVSVFPLVHPDDLLEATRGFGRTVAGLNRDVALEMRVRHADGSWRIIEALSGRITAASGAPGF